MAFLAGGKKIHPLDFVFVVWQQMLENEGRKENLFVAKYFKGFCTSSVGVDMVIPS